MNSKVYIIKPYNKYLLPQCGQSILYKFELYGVEYCICSVDLLWGKPVVARLLQQDDDFGYHLYNTYQQALSYIKQIKNFAR